MNIKNWLKRKSDSRQPLDLYNKRPGEPESSVMESLDYDFAVSTYSRDDFRCAFINAYISYVKEFCNKVFFNCRFERPFNNAQFLNLYIYMDNPEPFPFRHIDNPEHEYILAFYAVLKKCNLPGITMDTRIQFILRDIVKTMKAVAVEKAWQDIHEIIKDAFPECMYLSSWNLYFYVFINSGEYEQTGKNKERLEELKRYCYEAVKKFDKDNVWTYADYHIYIDDYKIYEQIGGQNYFNSDAMNVCFRI